MSIENLGDRVGQIADDLSIKVRKHFNEADRKWMDEYLRRGGLLKTPEFDLNWKAGLVITIAAIAATVVVNSNSGQRPETTPQPPRTPIPPSGLRTPEAVSTKQLVSTLIPSQPIIETTSIPPRTPTPPAVDNPFQDPFVARLTALNQNAGWVCEGIFKEDGDTGEGAFRAIKDAEVKWNIDLNENGPVFIVRNHGGANIEERGFGNVFEVTPGRFPLRMGDAVCAKPFAPGQVH